MICGVRRAGRVAGALMLAALASCASDQPLAAVQVVAEVTTAPESTTPPLRPVTPTPIATPTAIAFASPAPEPDAQATAAPVTVAPVTVEPVATVVETTEPAPATVVPATTAVPATVVPAVTVVPVPAATVAPVPTQGDSQGAVIANGAEVYTLNCANCHAENGLGNFQYSGLIGVGSKYTTAGMTEELTSGHRVTFGFATKLSADEISQVVAYVKATFP